nr:heparan-alpha-glucosaminide N-acetyltransferase [Methanosarcina horonobensis]
MGLIITVITRIFFPGQYILFGILHFFGVSAVLAYPFLKYGKENLFFGLFFVLVGLYLKDRTFGFSALLWLGLRPEGFVTLDYFPIFPWFGVLLTGIFLGNSMYKGGNRQYKAPEADKFLLQKPFSWIGKHSLSIYFIHQPLFLGLLLLSGLLSPDML